MANTVKKQTVKSDKKNKQNFAVLSPLGGEMKNLLSRDEMQCIVDGNYENVMAVLGIHKDKGSKEVYIRAYKPNAKSMELLDGDNNSLGQLTKLHEGGFFQINLGVLNTDNFKHKFRITNYNGDCDQIDATKATVTGISSSYSYTGSAIKPAPTVKLDGVTLTSGTDYDVSYSSNTTGPTATVKITFKGRYKGTISKTFTINRSTYTVTFNMNGHGSSISSQSILDGNLATEPTAPTATGYTFGGWYKEKACTNKFDFKTKITGNITLYAKWTANVYSVTFNTNGGSSISKVSVSYGNKLAKPSDPTKTSTDYLYSFEGWYTDSNLTSKYDFNKTVTSSFTLYAKWSSKLKVEVNVDAFINNYLHPEISFSDNSKTGKCFGNNGYYALAKQAFNNLSSADKEYFLSQDKYESYLIRLEAWADANGEYFNNGNIIQKSTPIINSNNLDKNIFNETFTIVALISTASFTLLLILFKKRKTK
jgi:uncharacterized repeat protein (TIGR02543 family)